MSKTKISYATEAWQVLTGCSKISVGCESCFAARLAATRLRGHPRYKGLAFIEGEPGHEEYHWTGEVRLHEDLIDEPLHWKKPRRVFVAPMSDLFHEDVPTDFRLQCFVSMSLANQHTYLLLTKRPENAKRFFEVIMNNKIFAWSWRWPFPNVILGVTVCNQSEADEKIPLLLQTPAAHRFVSIEPCLSQIDLSKHLWQDCPPECTNAVHEANGHRAQTRLLDWVILGGESGPHARSMDLAWARDVRDQCNAAGVAYYFKQVSGRGEIPKDLQIRQFPEVILR